MILKELWFCKKTNELNIYRWNGENNRNFWDILWPYLLEKISGKVPNRVRKHCFTPYYLTIWSILSNSNKNALVWWSGIISKKENVNKPHKIYSVRWPKTRERLLELWYDCPEIYGDPALLIRNFYTPKTQKTYQLWIIPHYVDYEKVCNLQLPKNVKIINILDPIEKVIDEIYSCEKTISSSLHGIIVSHTYNIPSIWVEFSKKLAGDGVKFEDYFLSVWLEPYQWYNYSTLPEISEIINLINVKHSQSIQIDLNKIMEACPFK